MLVLSRETLESVHIGDNIVVTVVEIRGHKVRLGFEAPRDVGIHRKEVFLKIQRDRAATTGCESDVQESA